MPTPMQLRRYARKARADYKALVAYEKTVPEKVKKYVKRTVDKKEEIKYSLVEPVVWDATITPLPSTGIGILSSHHPSMIQGDGGGNRTGDQITIHRLEARLNFVMQNSVETESVRIVMVRHDNPRGATPLVNEFLTPATGYNYFRPLLPKDQLKGSCKVLYDKTFKMKVTGNTTNISSNHLDVKIVKRFKNGLKVNYNRNSNTGLINDVDRNVIYVYVFPSGRYNVSTAGAPGTLVNPPTVQPPNLTGLQLYKFVCQVEFRDA